VSLIVSPAKEAGSSVDIPFDFTAYMFNATDTVASAAVTSTLWMGTDPNPGALVQGTPILSGLTATVSLVGGVEGCVYKVSAAAVLSPSSVTAVVNTYVAVVSNPV
jgi:hypothetical protein